MPAVSPSWLTSFVALFTADRVLSYYNHSGIFENDNHSILSAGKTQHKSQQLPKSVVFVHSQTNHTFPTHQQKERSDSGDTLL
jgi:hypothetical protein